MNWDLPELDARFEVDATLDGSGATGLEHLSAPECFRLAARRPVGRVALSIDGLPAVVPVNFCFVGYDVVFRTALRTKFAAALSGTVVAFEVDDFEPVGHRGWSVMIIGAASEISEGELAEIEPLPVRPWAQGTRDLVVRVRTDRVSGRRITTTPIA